MSRRARRDPRAKLADERDARAAQARAAAWVAQCVAEGLCPTCMRTVHAAGEPCPEEFTFADVAAPP